MNPLLCATIERVAHYVHEVHATDLMQTYIESAKNVPLLTPNGVPITGSLPYMLSTNKYGEDGNRGLFEVSDDGEVVKCNRCALDTLSTLINELVTFITQDSERYNVAWRCSVMLGFSPSDENMRVFRGNNDKHIVGAALMALMLMWVPSVGSKLLRSMQYQLNDHLIPRFLSHRFSMHDLLTWTLSSMGIVPTWWLSSFSMWLSSHSLILMSILDLSPLLLLSFFFYI